MSDFFEIANWLDYQHYGDKKKVPWIKLHYEILTDEKFSVLDDKGKLLMIVCMVIASRHNGKVPNNPKHIQRLGNLDTPPNFKPLINCGFLICQNESRQDLTLSRENQILSTDSLSLSLSLSSSESGKGGVGEKPKVEVIDHEYPDWLPVEDFQDFLAMRKRMKKALDEKAKKLTIKRLEKWRSEGYDISEILQNSIMNSYQGLFAPSERKTNGKQRTKLTDYEIVEQALNIPIASDR